MNFDPLSTEDTIYVKVDKVGTNYYFDEPMLFRMNVAWNRNRERGSGPTRERRGDLGRGRAMKYEVKSACWNKQENNMIDDK